MSSEHERPPHSDGPSDPEELEQLARRLEAAAAEQREILDEAQRPGPNDAQDLRTMERAFEHAAQADPTAAAWRGSPALWILVASAAAALLLWLAPGDEATSDDGPAGVLLGREEIEILAPVGEVPAYAALRWSTPPRATRVELRVLDADTRALLHSERVTGRSELLIAPELSAPWPERITVHIEAFDADGASLGSCSASAWLAP